MLFTHSRGLLLQYTLDVLQEMANGGPLDSQRERRWPPPPTAPGLPPKKTVRVEDWKPEDESDYEDTEMLLGGDIEWRRKQALNGSNSPSAAAVVNGDTPAATNGEATTNGVPVGEANADKASPAAIE
jgi:hypothetical protein